MDIIHKVIQVLKENLNEEELIELSDRLDGDESSPDLLLHLLDEHLIKVRPDLYVSQDELGEIVSHMEEKEK